MENNQKHESGLVATVTARGVMAQVRYLAEQVDDREMARLLFTEMRNLTHKLAIKYRFPAEERKEAA